VAVARVRIDGHGGRHSGSDPSDASSPNHTMDLIPIVGS
jgi:hypothetical protein